MKKHPVLAFVLFLSVILIIASIMMAVIATMSTGRKPSFIREPVAMVTIEGAIFESLETLKQLKKIQEDKHIKAVVLRLDSPGGAVGPSQEIYKQVLALKKHKKVVVSMGSVAASGAYYIACAADKIVANPGTITGSIGVIMESFGLQELVKKVYVEPRTIKSGAYKDVGNPFKDLTEEDRAYLQNIIDNVYGQFTKAVAEHRGFDLNKMDEIAQGRIFTGEQAKQIGLVDELGNIYDAINLAKSLAGLPKDASVEWPKEPSPFEKFFAGDNARSLLNQLVEKVSVVQLPLLLFDDKKLPAYQ